jgi:hypothetical protein
MDALTAFIAVKSSFACTCIRACTTQKITAVGNGRSPATVDLTNRDNDLRGLSCKDHAASNLDVTRSYYYSIQLVVFKKLTEWTESVVYTKETALADASNILGLFFGISVCSVYIAGERSLGTSMNERQAGLC